MKCGDDFHYLHYKLFEKLKDKKYDIKSTRTPKGWMMIRRKINEEIPCPISDRTYEREKAIKDIIE